MRFINFFVLFILFSFNVFGKDNVYQLSTHILDIGKGMPAADVEIILFKLQDDKSWKQIDKAVTDNNGRISNFLSNDKDNSGIYKLQFNTKEYFEDQDLNSIYPFVDVVFEIKGNGHYHIPINMSANGYSTYRGN